MRLQLRAHVAASLPPFLTQKGSYAFIEGEATMENPNYEAFLEWIKERSHQRTLRALKIDCVMAGEPVASGNEVIWDSEDQKQPEEMPKSLQDYDDGDLPWSGYEERGRNIPIGIRHKLYKIDPRNSEPAPQSSLEHYQETYHIPKEFDLKVAKNPFPESKIQALMFRLDKANRVTFPRLASGVWFCTAHKGGTGVANKDQLYACWLDVRNPYIPTEKEARLLWGRSYEILQPFLNNLKKKGYDSYLQGEGHGDITVFDSVQILNAETGKLM